VDVRTAGQQLAVAALLEGSVRTSDGRLRVTVQLVDVASGHHRWSQRFDRPLDDVFAIQEEIAASVATALRSVLSQHERAALHRPQTFPRAYEYYLRGRQRMDCLRQSDLDPSREMFERAIELDGAYAPAWAGLAMLHATMYEWWGAHDEDLDRAERASRTALDLAPTLADAHVARGRALSLTRRYEEAERSFKEAIRINPNLFEAHYFYGRSCFARGEVNHSAQLFHRAAEVRREDFQSLVLAAQSLRMLGRTNEAQADRREGIARAERLLALNPFDGRVLSLGSLALFDEGQTERAFDWSRRSLDLYPDEVSVLINGACLRTKAGLKEDALELLTRVFARGCGNRDWVEHDPDFRVLHDDPRFQELVAKLT
jgi:tetratricopeptide (TPR) repeat protein